MTLAHATPELLTAYADGSLSEGLSLLVASHLTFCPACRRRVARLEALGGALLCDGA
ncbi:MAG: zf-HC2 domain-containing protein [Rhodobacteraceae bacterium]|nr:zf-HC2 domain-containing protein [Paracoccaceae bacterium]